MIVATVIQVLKLDKGDAIPALKGRVSKVWPQRTGKKKDSDDEWTKQGIVLADLNDSKKTVELAVWDKDEIPAAKLEGKVVWVYTEAGTKAKITADSYKDKIQVKVPKSAKISLKDPAGEDEAEPEPEKEEPQKKAKPEPEPEEAVGESVDESTDSEPKTRKPVTSLAPISEIQRHYFKRANCLRLAADANVWLIKSFYEAHGVDWSKELEADITLKIGHEMCKTVFTTLFLSLKRDGRDQNLADTMPAVANLDAAIATLRAAK
jgi:hypothetical protein